MLNTSGGVVPPALYSGWRRAEDGECSLPVVFDFVWTEYSRDTSRSSSSRMYLE